MIAIVYDAVLEQFSAATVTRKQAPMQLIAWI